MTARRYLIAAAIAAALAAGCAHTKPPRPFGDVEPTLPDKKRPEGNGAYHGVYVPGAVVGT